MSKRFSDRLAIGDQLVGLDGHVALVVHCSEVASIALDDVKVVVADESAAERILEQDEASLLELLFEFAEDPFQQRFLKFSQLPKFFPKVLPFVSYS